VSDNGGYTYGQLRLIAAPDGQYRHRMPGLSSTAILIAEVENQAGAITSSAPKLAARFRPVLRPFGDR